MCIVLLGESGFAFYYCFDLHFYVTVFLCLPQSGLGKSSCFKAKLGELFSLLWFWMNLLLSLNLIFQEFPGCPVVRTPRFHCHGPGFNPWSGN